MSAPTTEKRLVEVLLDAVQTALRARRSVEAEQAARDTADAALQLGFEPVWRRLPQIELAIGEVGVEFDGEVVLRREDDHEGFIAALAAAGIESLTLVPGVELEEIKLVLGAIASPRDKEDGGASDLLTSLFRADLHHMQYTVAGAQQPASSIARATPEPLDRPAAIKDVVRRDAESEGPASGVVQLETFDSTLYFLDEREIEYLKSAIDREYALDLPLNAVTLLLDVLELQTAPTARDEVIGILEDYLPELLAEGNFEAVAHLLSGVREVSREAEELADTHKDALDGLRASVSRPRALLQLFHALEGGALAPTAESMGVLLRELRPKAVRQVLGWADHLTDPEVRAAVVVALDAFFTEWPHSLARMVNAPDQEVVQAGLDLAGRLKRPEFVDIVGDTAQHADAGVRRQVAETLAAIASAPALRRLVDMAEDDDAGVRVVVYRTFAARPFRPAFTALQRALTMSDLEERGRREKRALFEAFGGVAGADGVDTLAPLLRGGGPFGHRPSPHTRACAAIALGLISDPEATRALKKASNDRDPVVRNAANAALRGEVAPP